jgi:hypothetical protein
MCQKCLERGSAKQSSDELPDPDVLASRLQTIVAITNPYTIHVRGTGPPVRVPPDASQGFAGSIGVADGKG